MNDTTGDAGTAAGGLRSSSARRVVVGVDASEESKKALRWAADYARFIGARLEAVHTPGFRPCLRPPARPRLLARNLRGWSPK